MKIISIKKGFTADHSSTSYEFLAIDEPLDKEARNDVGSLSSRTNPTAHRASFIYHAEGYDLPREWEELMKEYYDVMYRESYGWYTISLAFNMPESKQREVTIYDFRGIEDMGVFVRTYGERVIVKIYCMLDQSSIPYKETSYNDNYYYEYKDEEKDVEDLELDDPFLEFLKDIREDILDGNYEVLDAIWDAYVRPLYSEEEIAEIDCFSDTILAEKNPDWESKNACRFRNMLRKP